MGGLDIFIAENTSDGAWGQPVNLKSPINSSGDDLGIVFDAEKESGYLGSNRPGGKGQDDIYRFYLPELLFALQGTVNDKVTNLPIPGALVEVTGTDGSTFSANADQNGDFSFIEKSKSERYINPGTTYSIRASAHRYLVCTDQFTTVGVEESTTFVRDQFLQPIRDSIPLPTVLYDTDEYLLTAQAKDSLEYLHQTLIENPTIVVQLRSHTDSRPTYKYRGGNVELSQKRAQTCVNYLIERGINPARMVPVGMGPSQPLVDDVAIAALPTEAERLAAHQCNRRTDFKVLRTDFVAPAEPSAPVQRE